LKWRLTSIYLKGFFMLFRRGNIRQSNTRNWLRHLPLWRDATSMVKDSLDIVWRVAPLTLLPAGLVLWVYLHEIGWPDLFRESALSISSLLSLVLATFILTVCFLALFLAPSFMMITTVQELHRNGLIQREVIRLYAGGVIGWLIGMLLIWQSANLWWSLFVVPCVIVTFLGLANGRQRWRGSNFADKLKQIVKILVVAVCATFTVAFTALPLPFVMRFVLNNPGQYSPSAQYLLFAASLIVTMIGLLPGYVYLATITSPTSPAAPARPLKPTLVAAGFISFMMMFAFFLFAPVSSFVLASTAVYSNELASFQVLNPDLFKLMKSTGLKTSDEDNLSVVQAYVRYNFGGVELLCASAYSPRKSGELKEKGEDPHPPGLDCVRTQSSELRRFRTTKTAAPAVENIIKNKE
jgi:hypothetical protein